MADATNSQSEAESASNEMNKVSVSNESSTTASGKSEMSTNENSRAAKTMGIRDLGTKFLKESEANLKNTPSSTSLVIADSGNLTVESFGAEELRGDEREPEKVERGNRDKMMDLLHTESEITWVEPGSLSCCSSGRDSDDITSKEGAESSDHTYLKIKEDVKELANLSHGYTLIEEPGDGGEKKVSRTFYPRISKLIRSFKTKMPISIIYNKLSADETGVVEEEDVVDEEMEVDDITDTIIVKTNDEEGNEIEKEVEVKTTRVHDPTKHRRYLKLQMVNDQGQVVDELIELTDDSKRTQEILQAAAPYMKKKIKEKNQTHVSISGLAQNEDDEDVSLINASSFPYSDWMKLQNTQYSQVLHKAIIDFKQAMDERKTLKQINKYLGKKLCQHYDFKGKKDPQFKYTESENNEEERFRYREVLLELGEVVNYIFAESKVREKLITSAGNGLQKQSDELTDVRHMFYDMEEAMARDVKPNVQGSETNRTLTFQEIINRQKMMDSNLTKTRFEYINSQLILKDLKEREAKFQTSIDDREQVDFINYEAMRAKTKDLNDKLDLKEKQILAMKDTMTNRVQALAHVRLKKESLTTENEKLKEEKNLIEQELKDLREESIKVQQERRLLERRMDNVSVKEGMEKYPYVLKESPNVLAKDEDQRQLLSELVIRCSEMKSIIQRKMEEHKRGAERYQEIKAQRRQRKKLISFHI